MTIAELVTIGGAIVAVIAGLIRHAQVDARYRQRLKSLEHRVTAIDGIESNGN